MNLAIDAGGTNLRAKLWDGDRCVACAEAKSARRGLYAWIETLMDKYKGVRTIGISYAGQVKDGTIISAPNISVDVYNIKERVESKHPVELRIENDLSCAVLAHAKEFGSGDICTLSLGTGLGLGVVERGRLVRGFNNVASEIGHIPYRRAPFRCGCGRDNCLELYASGSGLAKWIECKKLSCGVSLEELQQEGGHEVTEMFYEALLTAAGTALTLFNPNILVLQGGVIEANPHLIGFVSKNIKEYAFSNSLEGMRICKSPLDNASLEGALLLKDLDD